LYRAAAETLSEQAESHGDLPALYSAYKTHLMEDLTPDQFADLYAQALTYGLFLARMHHDEASGSFTRRRAYDLLPRSVALIKNLFRYLELSDEQFPVSLRWIVDDLAALLDNINLEGVLRRYAQHGEEHDPVFYFYETFLSEYRPDEREQRGVYYTPEPVVSYIVRSVDKLLRRDFGKRDGLATQEGVTLLDPAVGTGTFLAHSFVQVRDDLLPTSAGIFPDVIRNHALRNFAGFELLAAPYVIAHLKLTNVLAQLGYEIGESERLGVYLTNTLVDHEGTGAPGLFERYLAEESRAARGIKHQQPVLVVLGNPPYSGHSFNRSPRISGLLDDYKRIDGQPLGERNPKWLQDDYVKFIRWAQWKITEWRPQGAEDYASRGIVAMITNNAYLDNPTFRGMRKALIDAFSSIYILNLHGNARRRERAPDGSQDVNVFGIRPGVAVALFVKTATNEPTAPAAVHYCDSWGPRATKYRSLAAADVEDTEWSLIHPDEPFYFFVPHVPSAEYRSWPSIREIMPLHSMGVTTGSDDFLVGFDDTDLRQKLNRVVQGDPEARQRTRDRMRRGDLEQTFMRPYSYRPFDVRVVYYDTGVLERSRAEVMRHLGNDENYALVTIRRARTTERWNHAFISRVVVDKNAVSSEANDTVLPLFRYDPLILEPQTNFAGPLLQQLHALYGSPVTPEYVLFYIYGVLNAPSFREEFLSDLLYDFPRIPFPEKSDDFFGLSELGQRLAFLHLLEAPDLRQPLVTYCPVSRK